MNSGAAEYMEPSSPPFRKPPAPLDDAHPITGLREAIRALNQVDDAMMAYDNKRTIPSVTRSLDAFVQALKKVQDGRHVFGDEDIPLDLLERMEKEGLNPDVYTIERLEKGLEDLEAVALRDQLLEEIKEGMKAGMKRKERNDPETQKSTIVVKEEDS